MATLFSGLMSGLIVIQVILAGLVAYLLVLTAAACWPVKRRGGPVESGRFTRFAILIPAHNEETILPDLLTSIRSLDYPSGAFDVYVVADNCTDQTARAAAAAGAQVIVRTNDRLIGKGYALNWGLDYIRALGEPYDAFIIVDADSTLSANFLQVMHAQAAGGAQVVQAYYGVRDPGASWNTSLRYAALAVLHYLRPLGRLRLGASAGLKGNGMLFTRAVLDQHPWPGSGTEDIEYHMTLLLAGHRVIFAPEASVWGEMPVRFDQSQTQLDRWEAGRLDMARLYIPRLLRSAGQALSRGQWGQAYRCADAVLEHLIPPFSALFGLSLGVLVLDGIVALGGLLITGKLLLGAAYWGLFLVLGQVVYLIAGLRLVGAPPGIYRSLVFAPVFMIRKLGQYIRILAGRRPDHWVKTARNEPN